MIIGIKIVKAVTQRETGRQTDRQTDRQKISVAEWYFQCVIVLSEIVGLHVLGCHVDILRTNWLNLDDDEVLLNVLRCQLTY